MNEPIDRYLVIHEHTCPLCGGDGWIYNREWIGANEAHDAAYNPLAKRARAARCKDEWYELGAAAADAGFDALKWYWAERGYHNMRNWPLEEEVCPDCGGDGIVRKEVDLREALEEVQK